jgi:hypothetical protein
MKTMGLFLALLLAAMPAFSQSYYNPDILSLIDVHGCASCHGGTAGFFVTPYDSIMHSGNHGPEVVPFDTNSTIVLKLKGTAPYGARMPFGGPYLSPDEIALVVNWIKGGALQAAPSGVALQGGDVPARTALEPNFPNPFNPTTTIGYRVSTASWIKLSIFDLLGREVAVLESGFRSPGSYRTEWNASGSPSGLYFCRLEAGSYRETRKIVLER